MKKIKEFTIFRNIFLIILFVFVGSFFSVNKVQAQNVPLGTCFAYVTRGTTGVKSTTTYTDVSQTFCNDLPKMIDKEHPELIQVTWMANSITLPVVTLPPTGTTGGSNGLDTNIKPATGSLVTCVNDCGWSKLIDMVNRVIKFILFDMVLPIAAIMFTYAGFLLVTAGGEAAHARAKAKEIFTNAVIGLVIAVAAYLIIQTILSILGWNGSWIGFNPLPK
jgi:hypothetical protein